MDFTKTLDQLDRSGTFTTRVRTNPVRIEGSNLLVRGSSVTISGNKTTDFRPGVFRVNPVVQWTHTAMSDLLPVTSIDMYYSGNWQPQSTFWGYPLRWRANYRDYGSAATQDTTVGSMVRCSAAAKANAPEADIAMMLAESGETMAMLGGLLGGLLRPWKLLHKLPRGMSSPKRISSYLSSKWLEYRYGIMPTLMDIQSLHDLYVNDVIRPVDQIRKKSAMKSKPKELILTEAAGYSDPYVTGIGYQWMTRVYQESKVSSHVYYRVKCHNPNLGGGLHNIFPLAWELVPYSFVIDWFFNIGDFLRVSYPNPDNTELGNTIGYKEVITQITDLVNVYCAMSGYTYRTSWNQAVVHQTFDIWSKFTRVVNTPLPSFPLVDYGLDNVKHIIDGVTLSWQRLAHLIPKR